MNAQSIQNQLSLHLIISITIMPRDHLKVSSLCSQDQSHLLLTCMPCGLGPSLPSLNHKLDENEQFLHLGQGKSTGDQDTKQYDREYSNLFSQNISLCKEIQVSKDQQPELCFRRMIRRKSQRICSKNPLYLVDLEKERKEKKYQLEVEEVEEQEMLDFYSSQSAEQSVFSQDRYNQDSDSEEETNLQRYFQETEFQPYDDEDQLNHRRVPWCFLYKKQRNQQGRIYQNDLLQESSLSPTGKKLDKQAALQQINEHYFLKLQQEGGKKKKVVPHNQQEQSSKLQRKSNDQTDNQRKKLKKVMFKDSIKVKVFKEVQEVSLIIQTVQLCQQLNNYEKTCPLVCRFDDEVVFYPKSNALNQDADPMNCLDPKGGDQNQSPNEKETSSKYDKQLEICPSERHTAKLEQLTEFSEKKLTGELLNTRQNEQQEKGEESLKEKVAETKSLTEGNVNQKCCILQNASLK